MPANDRPIPPANDTLACGLLALCRAGFEKEVAAALVAEWVATGRCRRSIFNLRLPMKKRLDAIAQCRKLIHARLAGVGPYDLRIRHLYHDREEVTAYLALRR